MTRDSVCPACEAGELRPDPFPVRCSGCDYAMGRNLFLALRAIRALPEAIKRNEGQDRSTIRPGEEG